MSATAAHWSSFDQEESVSISGAYQIVGEFFS
jgi:hypothetical protein